MLSGHLDTVTFGEQGAWDTPPDRAVVAHGRLFGRGAADMKSGLCGAHPYLTAPTCSLTTMRGGVKTNMLPDCCELSLDIRTIPGVGHGALLEKIEAAIKRREENGAKFRITIQNDRMAVETSPDATLTRELRDAVARVRGSAPEFTGTGFFSDASVFLRDRDIPTVLFGPGESSQAHKPNESVALEEYYSAVECCREFLRRQ